MPYQDDISKITNYAPYVETTPIRTLEMAGAQRQQQYDQGMQLIQQTSQQTKDLSGQMMRPVDQEYLQTKLSQTQNALASSITGDLSSMSLVNNINGAIKNVANDDIIKSAIISTGNHTAQKSLIDKHVQEGKSSVENQWDYNNQLNSYLQGTKPGELFNGKYTPYVDVNKKIIDLSKAAGVDEKTVQQLFQTDKYGNPTGRINEVMAEQHFKGVDKQKLLSEFTNSLTPDDYKQLSITGRYNMQSYTPDKLKSIIDNSYTSNKDFFENAKQNSLVELTALQNKQSLSATEKQRLQQLTQSISNLTENLSSLDKSYAKNLDDLHTNPEQLKASLYTDNYLTSMAKSLAHTEESTLYKINPWYEVQMKNKEFAAQQDYRRQQQNNWEKQFSFDKTKSDRELSLKFGKIFKDGKVVDEALSTPFTTLQGDTPYNTEYQTRMSSLQESLNLDNNKIGLEWLKMSLKNDPTAPKNSDDYNTFVNKKLNKIAEATGQSKEKVLERYASSFMIKYKDNPNYKHLNVIMDRILENTNDLHTLQIADKSAEAKAIQRLKEEGINFNTNDNILKSIPEKTTEGVLGKLHKNISLNKQDVLDFATIYNSFPGKYAAGIFTPNEIKQKASEAKDRLKRKYNSVNQGGLTDYDLLYSQVIPDNGWAIAPIIYIQNKLNSNTNSKFTKYKDEALKNNPITQYYQGEINPILYEKDKEGDFKAKLTNIVLSMGDKNLEPGFDKEEYLKHIADDKQFSTANVFTSTNMDGTHDHKLIVVTKDGKQHQMTINKQQAELGSGKQFNDRERADKMSYTLLQSPTGSTNLSKTNPNYLPAEIAATTANISPKDFSKVQIQGQTVLGGEYNIDDNKKAWMSIYVKNNETQEVKKVTLNHSFQLTNLSLYPQGVTSHDVIEELKNK